MSDISIQSLLKSLAEDLVFAEISDLQLLALIINKLEQVAEWAKSNSQDLICIATQKAARLVEKIILEETEEPVKDFDIVNKVVETIQTVICEELTLEEVNFPPELGIEIQSAVSDSEQSEFAVQSKPNDTMDSIDDCETTDDLSDDEVSQYHPGELPPNVDGRIFTDFLARQPSVLEEIESDILYLEYKSDPERFSKLKRSIHKLIKIYVNLFTIIFIIIRLLRV